MEKQFKSPAISTRKKDVEEDGQNFFKANLRWLRKNENLTQQALSEATGLSRATIGAYEEGRSYPNPNTLILLADHFGVRVDELIRETRRPAFVDSGEFDSFAKSHVKLDHFVCRADLYGEFLKRVPKTTPQSFKAQLENWCKVNGYTFNPSEYIDGQGRIVLRHKGRVAEFFYIKSNRS